MKELHDVVRVDLVKHADVTDTTLERLFHCVQFWSSIGQLPGRDRCNLFHLRREGFTGIETNVKKQ